MSVSEKNNETKLYPYPCEDECSLFLEEFNNLSFAEFAEIHCGSGCPDCVWLDLPYDDVMFKKPHP